MSKMLFCNNRRVSKYETVWDKYSNELAYFNAFERNKKKPVWFHNQNEKAAFFNKKKATYLIDILWNTCRAACCIFIFRYQEKEISYEEMMRKIRQAYYDLYMKYYSSGLTEGYENIALYASLDEEVMLDMLIKWHNEELEKINREPDFLEEN